jgi:hypothetical protein
LQRQTIIMRKVNQFLFTVQRHGSSSPPWLGGISAFRGGYFG